MPAKNVRKSYVKNGYYHLYNRGVEKRIIFQDQQDYSVFLSYLKEYLFPKDEKKLKEMLSNDNLPWTEKEKILKVLRLNNFSDEIVLLAFCLMPNHFHFFVKQSNDTSIDKFMNSLGTRYTMYFNKKYKRVGSLYQGSYKAVLVDNESQFLHLSRYIHRQAIILKGVALKSQPSSYEEYIGAKKLEWIHPEYVLNNFSNIDPTLSYKNFVEQEVDNILIKDLLLESDED